MMTIDEVVDLLMIYVMKNCVNLIYLYLAIVGVETTVTGRTAYEANVVELTFNFIVSNAERIEVSSPRIGNVGSQSKPAIVGDGGKALGPAQIHMGVVYDVNRIAGTHYTSDDRKSLVKSFEMFTIYTAWYAQHGSQSKPASDETLARIWNGGPRGPEKQATAKYWKKVKATMDTYGAWKKD